MEAIAEQMPAMRPESSGPEPKSPPVFQGRISVEKNPVVEGSPNASSIPEESRSSEGQQSTGEILSQGESSRIEGLNNQLARIVDETSQSQTMTKDPIELGLKLLKKDEYGFFLEIPQENRDRIEKAQRAFVPLFLEVREKYKDYEELNYINDKNPFAFSPLTVEVMSEELLPELLGEATKLFEGEREFTEEEDAEDRRFFKWNESEIQGILNKVLAFEAYMKERIMAPLARDHMLREFPGEEVLRIKEYCTGAGITTVLMYEALAETGKRIQFETVDNSLQSVMCAAALLSIRGIPTRIMFDPDKKVENFDGVVIYFDTARQFAQKDGIYHMQFSDNGINYFKESDHYEVLTQMYDNLLPGGLFMDCTLDPELSIDLSTMPMLGKIMFGKKTAKEGDGMYQLAEKDGKTVITQLFSPSSTMQYELLAKMFRRISPSVFWKYLMGAKKAGEITKTLSPKIAIGIDKTTRWFKEKHGFDLPISPSFGEQKYSLTRFTQLTKPR